LLNLWNAEDEMTAGHSLEDIYVQTSPEFRHALLVAGGVEVAALAEEGK
jgi:hypothetical protein